MNVSKKGVQACLRDSAILTRVRFPSPAPNQLLDSICGRFKQAKIADLRINQKWRLILRYPTLSIFDNFREFANGRRQFTGRGVKRTE
jgi:hypothetical protein